MHRVPHIGGGDETARAGIAAGPASASDGFSHRAVAGHCSRRTRRETVCPATVTRRKYATVDTGLPESLRSSQKPRRQMRRFAVKLAAIVWFDSASTDVFGPRHGPEHAIAGGIITCTARVVPSRLSIRPR